MNNTHAGNMALCISNDADIKRLLSEIMVFQNRILTNRITEILKYVLRGIERDSFRVMVDAWPDWDFLLLEHHRADDTKASGFTTAMLVWAKTGGALCDTLKTNHHLISDGHILGVETDQAKDIRDGVRHCGKEIRFLNPLAIFDIDVEKIPGEYVETYISLPHGFGLDDLRADDIEQIYGFWSFAGTLPKSLLKESLKHLPSACVRDSSGRCLSWGLITVYGEIHHLFTLPEHRGKGFAKAVLIKISKDCKDRGLRALAMVEEMNKPSIKVFENIIGVTRLPGTMITGIIRS